jgi:hypothetical protein
MNKGDELIERASKFLEELSQRASREGGLAAKLAEPLAEDAVFIRKLKPSLVKARLRGEPTTDGEVTLAPEAEAQTPPAPEAAAAVTAAPAAAPAPKPAKKRRGGGPNPIVVGGIAFVVGVFAAKLIDWRGHAHPRD